MPDRQRLFLCGGLQSSGSTLLSWCMLQRPDTDGVLDAANDILLEQPSVGVPNLWCKITISSFRLTEMIDHYRDEGWEVTPVLIVRDVRAVFNSLLGKTYGRNGTTAEDPPLRMRMRRFKEDWLTLNDQCATERCAVVRYESLVQSPEPTLRALCETLELPWQDAMLSWPKDKSDIADPGHGSPSFRRSRGETFKDTVDESMAAVRVKSIPEEDLGWLESEFAEFNRQFAYEPHLAPSTTCDTKRARPCFTNTRRCDKQATPVQRMKRRLMKMLHTAPTPRKSAVNAEHASVHPSA